MAYSGNKGVESVKDRLKRMQRNNYRSIPLRPEPKKQENRLNVDDEIEELKQSSMIKSMPIDRTAPKDDDGFVDLNNVKPKVEEEIPVPKPSDLEEEEFIETEKFQPKPSVVGNMLKDDNKFIDKLNVSLQKVEEIKKKMLKTDNFLGLYYDLNKAEKELVSHLNEASSQGVEVPGTLKSRIRSAVSSKHFD